MRGDARWHAAHAPDPPVQVAMDPVTTDPTTPPVNSTITVYLPREIKTAVRLHCVHTGQRITDYVLGLIRKDLGQ